MARPLVVVGKAVALEADLHRPRRDQDAARGRRCRSAALRSGAIHARLGELQRLQHRLVVLVLVLDQHLADEGRHAVEAGQRALAHRLHVGDRLVAAQVGQVAALGPRRLGGVVDLREVGAQQLQPGLAAHPQVLERGDVAEVPDQRAHQRVVHGGRDPRRTRARRGRACARRASSSSDSTPPRGAVLGMSMRATRTRARRGRRCARARATRRGSLRAARSRPRRRP